MSELHDLAPGYVLDALSEVERRRFERHLVSCAECLATVAALQEATVELAETLAEEPPARLRRRVLTEVAVTRQPRSSRLSPRAIRMLGAAAALVMLMGGGWWLAGADQRLIDSMLTGDDTVVLTAAVTPAGEAVVGQARLLVDRVSGRAVLVADDLEPLPGHRVYEAWVIGAAGPRPAGLFRVAPDGGATVLLEGRVPSGSTVAVTIEPSGGSDLPTGEVLMTAEI